MNREIYVTDGILTIYPLSEEDKENYFELRRQVSTISNVYSDSDKNEMFWKAILSSSSISYSIFDENEEYCGNLLMQEPLTSTPEIGIDILESKRNKGIAVRAIKLTAKKFYEENTLEYFLIKAREENTHSRHMIEKTGAVFVGMEESPYKKLMRDCINSAAEAGDEKYNEIFEQRLKAYDELPDDVCVYKLMPESFI